ncbi:MAG: hypothetical protein RRC07_04710 [Anaerolineae bacterium]|nr:hypothetical protein [Anaerolineae bacterium]
MLQPRQLAGRGNKFPRTTQQLPHYLLLAGILLFALAQLQAPAHAEEASPIATSTVFWETFQLVASTNAVSDFAPRPTLRQAPNGQLMLSFNKALDVSQGIQKPYYSVYNRANRSWSNAQPIYSGGTSQRYVTFAFDNASMAHAVWLEREDVYYAARSGWPTTARKLSTVSETLVDPPAIAIGANGVIHVVWAQGVNSQTVFYTFSADGGANWSSPDPLTPAADDTYSPAVAATDDGSVHVVWGKATLDPPPSRYELYYAKGTAQGTGYNWTTALNISADRTTAVRPALMASGNALHLAFASYAFEDERFIHYAHYRRYSSGNWTPLVTINSDRGVSVNTSYPTYLTTALTVCGGDVHLYYHGAPPGQTSEQIWAASSSDAWQSLSPVTALGTRYIDPTLACNNGNLAIAVDRVTLDNNVHDIYWGSQENRVLLPLISSR